MFLKQDPNLIHFICLIQKQQDLAGLQQILMCGPPQRLCMLHKRLSWVHSSLIINYTFLMPCLYLFLCMINALFLRQHYKGLYFKTKVLYQPVLNLFFVQDRAFHCCFDSIFNDLWRQLKMDCDFFKCFVFLIFPGFLFPVNSYR